MPAVLLTYTEGATIATFDSTSSQAGLRSSTPLPIPSRFPATSTPQTAVSPSGHVYLWCHEVNVVWEYDSKARRVGEMVIKNGPIKRVLGAGKVEGKETAVVETEVGLGVWAKASTGKWESMMKLEVPRDMVALAASSDFGLLAALGGEELLIYNMRSGSRESVFLGKDLYREPAIAMAFAQTTNCMIVASAYNVLRICLSQSKRETREINAGKEDGKILAICTAPTAEPSEMCAVLRDGGRISLCGLDTPDDFARTITCSEELVDITSVVGTRVIGRTTSGEAFMQDTDQISSPAIRVPFEHRITALHVMQLPATAPQTTNAVRRSASASVLGESRNAGNVQPRPQSSQSGGNLKGKLTHESIKNVRVVSAPSQTQKVAAPRPLPSRSTSQPVTRHPRPSSSMAHLPAIQDEEEDEAELNTVLPTHNPVEQSIDLTWALRAGPSTANNVPAQSGMDVNTVDELRREISNLQLDMLRMARGLKNEIRNAIKPLVDELRDSRETNERQRLEIDRLRSGY